MVANQSRSAMRCMTTAPTVLRFVSSLHRARRTLALNPLSEITQLTHHFRGNEALTLTPSLKSCVLEMEAVDEQALDVDKVLAEGDDRPVSARPS
ncbi:hypothetical protein BASA81_007595 [Batrachochytrium salamandrivorans]|nr:hypothetical protein BASA81_007595 [Batrachochytrium salamandrivorans]